MNNIEKSIRAYCKKHKMKIIQFAIIVDRSKQAVYSIWLINKMGNYRKKILRRRSSVYIMECGGFYKIGYTYNPDRRLQEIQISNPFKVELIYSEEMNFARKIEAQIHDEFLNKQKRGEWFELTKEDLEMVKKSIKEFKKS